MKYLKWGVGVLVLAIVPLFAWVSIAGAQRFSNTIEKDQTVNSSLYSAGKNIEINGTINGDVFCAGQTVKIDATVNGDVICAAQDITISGKINGDVRVAGQSVTLKAEIANSATVAAMTFSLDAGTSVGRDLTATGDTLNIKGRVGRDVVATGNNVTFNGPVGRNVKADGAKVRLKSDARIAGNFTYTSDNKVETQGGAAVTGKTSQVTPKKDAGSGPRFSLGLYLFVLFGLLLISLTIAYLFPQFLKKNSDQIKKSFIGTFLTGLIASLLVPMVSLGLVFSIVGIPLVFFAFVGWLFASLLTAPIAGYYVGRLIFRDKRKNPLLIMLVGGLVLTTSYFFWIAGIFFLMLSYWIGLGALLNTLKENVRSPFKTTKAKKEKEEA